jgi:hypothetical protein
VTYFRAPLHQRVIIWPYKLFPYRVEFITRFVSIGKDNKTILEIVHPMKIKKISGEEATQVTPLILFMITPNSSHESKCGHMCFRLDMEEGHALPSLPFAQPPPQLQLDNGYILTITVLLNKNPFGHSFIFDVPVGLARAM